MAMARFIFLIYFIIYSVTATSPIINEADDSLVPIAKPFVSVPRRCPPNEVLKSKVPCPPDTCDMLYLSVLCIADQTESLVCTCKDGYLRTNSTATGVCVPQDRCLPPECADDPNAKRGCGNRCGKTCADHNDTTKVCNKNVCKLFGCDCQDGFVYDTNINRCVKPEQCTKQCTKPHERYSICLLGECVPKTCNNVGYPVACPGIAGPCAGGCTCEEGFVRDCNGDCIDMKKCPCCGGDPNAVSGCGNSCGKTCASLYVNKSDLVCPEYCEYNGCDCKPGFLLLESNNTDSSKCIPERECPKPTPQCGKNEQYYCGTSCPEATCANPTPPTCVNKKCKLGCFCNKGFVRDANNKCILVEKCPPKCKGPHEKYIDCPAALCIEKTCKDLITPFPCPGIEPPCSGGCVCEYGYLRDSKGLCIKMEQCPLACKTNQTYVTCNANCPDKYCPKDDQPQPVCDPPRDCPPGCTCNFNYRYDQSGNCILASECPPVNCTGQNTEWDPCPSACLSEQCEDADSTPVICNNLLLNCQPRCVCKKGHFKNKDGLCVPAKECPSVCKDPNASWTDCKDACPRTCQNTNPGCVNKRCSAGCQCNAGYVLSKIGGKCVKIDECPDYANCGANQTFVECTHKCPQVMCPESDLILLCKPPRDCPGGCGCKPYYRYNATGDCIKASDCPSVECTGANQEWTSCQRISDWERCEDRYNSPPFNPGDPDDCTPKCVCKKGYWRNDAYECVPENECPPKCKGPHEKYIDCPAALCIEKTCKDLITPFPCPGIEPPCSGGCVCEYGYLRDSKGLCIKMEQCPLACKTNQTYVTCNANCPDKYCPKDDQPQPVCDPPRDCPPGCTCNFNYRYDQSGNCILASECPPVNCTDQNTEWDPCPSACLSEQCEDADSTPVICNNLLLNCQPRCVCKKGHFKNKDGLCVPAKECPSVCKDPNASWTDCKDACPRTCQNTNPGCVNKRCSAGCQCNAGYVLSKIGGKCVKIDECPDYANCGVNQTFVECTHKCPQVMCPESDLILLCKPPRDCPGGCGCKPYYRYNATGDCIKASDCPSVECTGANQEWTSCQRISDWERCEDRYNSPPFNPGDPDDCTPKCVCKKGYWRNDAYECVPENECPPKCKGPHEKYIDCPAALCIEKTCKDLITPFPCPGIEPPCSGGCVCEYGYLRDSKGLCIKMEQCPLACKTNQTYVTCNANCPDKYCPKDDQPQPVCDPPRDCPPGCTCNFNYRYDQSGNCILASECPPVNCTGQNTEWDPCPSACLSEQCEDADSTPVICNNLLLNCQPRCVCKKGHFKNKDGLCVPAKECPSVCKDPNASWTDCKDACPRTCQNTNPGCVNIRCAAGCQCNAGYVLSNAEGKCVKIEECPDYANCGANQTFVECTHKCPQVMCPESDLILLCKPPRDCPGGCGCKPYYRYNATGDCIKASDCPSVECTGANQEWTSCQRISDWERCEDRYNSPPFNPGDPDDCTPKCVCKKGYWRNDAYECVPENECPPLN